MKPIHTVRLVLASLSLLLLAGPGFAQSTGDLPVRGKGKGPEKPVVTTPMRVPAKPQPLRLVGAYFTKSSALPGEPAVVRIVLSVPAGPGGYRLHLSQDRFASQGREFAKVPTTVLVPESVRILNLSLRLHPSSRGGKLSLKVADDALAKAGKDKAASITVVPGR